MVIHIYLSFHLFFWCFNCLDTTCASSWCGVVVIVLVQHGCRCLDVTWLSSSWYSVVVVVIVLVQRDCHCLNAACEACGCIISVSVQHLFVVIVTFICVIFVRVRYRRAKYIQSTRKNTN